MFFGKFIDQNFSVLKLVRAHVLWKYIDSPLGEVPSTLRTTDSFGHLLALIQHQIQRVLKTYLCHFPNYENPEIGDQIRVATLQFHQHIQHQCVTFTVSKCTLQTRKKCQTHVGITAFAKILAWFQTPKRMWMRFSFPWQGCGVRGKMFVSNSDSWLSKFPDTNFLI